MVAKPIIMPTIFVTRFTSKETNLDSSYCRNQIVKSISYLELIKRQLSVEVFPFQASYLMLLLTV